MRRNAAADLTVTIQAIGALGDNPERPRPRDKLAAFEAALQEGNADIRGAAVGAVRSEEMQVYIDMLRSAATHDARLAIRKLARGAGLPIAAGPERRLTFYPRLPRKKPIRG
jgi:hypothetical protein